MIGIHALGPGFGESIILELPDRTVGIVDVHGTKVGGEFPAIDFLNERVDGLDWDPLRFLAVTHPHADHCRGVSQLRPKPGTRPLISEIEICWVFNTIGEGVFIKQVENILELQRKGVKVEENFRGVAAETSRLNAYLESLDERTFREKAGYIGMTPSVTFPIACGPKKIGFFRVCSG